MSREPTTTTIAPMEDEEEETADMNDANYQPHTLQGRVKCLKRALHQAQKGVANFLDTIANDEKVSKLSQAQAADYLRQN